MLRTSEYLTHMLGIKIFSWFTPLFIIDVDLEGRGGDTLVHLAPTYCDTKAIYDEAISRLI